MLWGITRYELKLQVRSLVFWLGLVLIYMLLHGDLYVEGAKKLALAQAWANDPTVVAGSLTAEMAAGFEELLNNGFSAVDQASKLADRLQIVLVFVALFTAGFVFDRDRISKGLEVLQSRPVSARVYAIGKYLGALLPLLIVSFIGTVTGYLMGRQLNAGLGLATPWLPYLKAWLLLVVPTLSYAVAVVLALALAFGRGAPAIPVYLGYMGLGGLIPFAGTFRFDLSTFIVRTDPRRFTLWTDDWSLLIANRALYLTLTIALLALAAHLLEKRRLQ